jgi:hypothetical protein
MDNEASVDFDWRAIDGASDPRREAEDQARAEKLEVIVRMVQLLGTAKTEKQVWRQVQLFKHYLRPEMDQTELAEKLGVTKQAVSAALDRLRAEIGGIL